MKRLLQLIRLALFVAATAGGILAADSSPPANPLQRHRATDERRATQLFEKAQEDFGRGKYADAKEKAKRSAELTDNNYASLRLATESAVAQEEYLEALFLAKAALDHSAPTDIAAAEKLFNVIARDVVRHSRPPDAVVSFRQVVHTLFCENTFTLLATHWSAAFLSLIILAAAFIFTDRPQNSKSDVKEITFNLLGIVSGVLVGWVTAILVIEQDSAEAGILSNVTKALSLAFTGYLWAKRRDIYNAIVPKLGSNPAIAHWKLLLFTTTAALVAVTVGSDRLIYGVNHPEFQSVKKSSAATSETRGGDTKSVERGERD